MRLFSLGALLFLVTSNSGVSGSAVGPLGSSALPPRFTEDSVILDPSIKNEQVPSPSARFRLPTQIVPRHYDLWIRPILDQTDPNVFTAPGTVQITVECLQATRDLVLNAAELNINEGSVRVWQSSNPGNELGVLSHSYDEDEMVQSYTITVNQTLVVGQRYEIYIEYVAKVANPSTERMNGVYWSSYVADNGERRYLATTQFSRARAFRKTLPSFDEPDKKATFAINVGRQDGFHSLSNMNLVSNETIPGLPGWVWDRYNTTPVMPPTIIAFIVSDFDYEEAELSLFDKPVRVWGPPPEIAGGGATFSVATAAMTLEYFQNYFEIEYELPKIDSAAIPDFAAGAMENWGLNTYRVVYLIWKEGVNTMAEKFASANVIGHELAHQYWGNLVTHAWWNDWWLTEGFASYFEYRAIDVIYPGQYGALNRLVTSDIQPALRFDSTAASVPIHGVNDTHFVENPSTINYQKGAALVNMLRLIMGEQVFKDALTHYLRKRAHTAVHQDALFDDLTEYLRSQNAVPSNGLTMNEIMDAWTTQTGFPLIRVTRGGPNHILVSQERFQNRDNPQDPYTSLWHVPVFYTTASEPPYDPDHIPRFWIDKNVLVMVRPVDTTAEWILLNPNAQGYYRVVYDDHFDGLLIRQLETDVARIPVGSRSMFVDDYFTAAYEGYISIQKALGMSTFMRVETNYNPWVPYIRHLTTPYTLFGDDQSSYTLLRTHLLNNMEAVLTSIGPSQQPGERPLNTITRVLIYNWACPLKESGCVGEAERLLTIWRGNVTVNPVPVDIRSQIYCAATANATSGNFEFLRQRYESDLDNAQLRNALACSDDQTQLNVLLEKGITDTTLTSAQSIALLQSLARNSDGRRIILTALEVRMAPLLARIQPTGVASVISTLATYTSGLETRTRIQQIATTTPELQPVLGQINNSLATIDVNRGWMQQYGVPMLAWLGSTSSSSPFDFYL